MENRCENCDRELVCSILGECFLAHEKVTEAPQFLRNQIKNARSVKQALAIFKAHKICTSVYKNRKSKTLIQD